MLCTGERARAADGVICMCCKVQARKHGQQVASFACDVMFGQENTGSRWRLLHLLLRTSKRALAGGAKALAAGDVKCRGAGR
eukprot:1138520-Pelagomonas_calceolata.AAC.4